MSVKNKKLQEMRQAKGLSQSQLAEKAGVKLGYLQQFECKAKPQSFNSVTLKKLLRICLALECRIEDVIDDPTFLELLQEMYDNDLL